ncbi:hypothetical protein HK100_005794 [Physocladia obscura]|uniref:SH3 domain-containing protein n=1 Tax=Physocladia obscura TaxID=109957 RepID=A0AAD5SWY5_9FUNG|nr:hypothetical protein HK100_005794 [Physocladia obscura]
MVYITKLVGFVILGLLAATIIVAIAVIVAHKRSHQINAYPQNLQTSSSERIRQSQTSMIERRQSIHRDILTSSVHLSSVSASSSSSSPNLPGIASGAAPGAVPVAAPTAITSWPQNSLFVFESTQHILPKYQEVEENSSLIINPTATEKIALRDFSPRIADEIAVVVGDRLLIFKSFEDGWCSAQNLRTRVAGICPLTVFED